MENKRGIDFDNIELSFEEVEEEVLTESTINIGNYKVTESEREFRKNHEEEFENAYISSEREREQKRLEYAQRRAEEVVSKATEGDSEIDLSGTILTGGVNQLEIPLTDLVNLNYDFTVVDFIGTVNQYRQMLGFPMEDIGFIIFQQGMANKGIDYDNNINLIEEDTYRSLIKKLIPTWRQPENFEGHTMSVDSWLGVLKRTLLSDITLRLSAKGVTSIKPLESYNTFSEYIAYLFRFLIDNKVVEVESLELTNAISTIEGAYGYIYNSLFTSGMAGVLTDDGVMFADDIGNVMIKTSPTYKAIYEVIMGGRGFKNIYDYDVLGSRSKINEELISLGFNIRDYKPNFNMLFEGEGLSLAFWHLACANGIVMGTEETLEKDYFNNLYDVLESGVRQVYREATPEEFRTFIRNLCNTVVCIEESVFHSTFKVSFDGVINPKEIMDAFNINKKRVYIGSGSAPDINKGPVNGTFSVKFIADEEKYARLPVFAYQLAENLIAQGHKPDLSRLVIGRDLSGDPMTIDLSGQDMSSILIGGGQRSGKGVLTMNIIGAAMAAGSPVIYFDGKPEVASIIMGITDKYGLKPVSWDGNLFLRSGAYPVDYDGYFEGSGKDSFALASLQKDFSTHLTYLKGMQLMLFDARYQVLNGTRYGREHRPIWVFDELLALTNSLGTIVKGFSELEKSLRKDKKTDSFEYLYSKQVLSWLAELSKEYTSIMLSEFPVSGLKNMGLYQNIQVNAFKDAAGHEFYDYVPYTKVSTSKSILKLLGRATFDGSEGLRELNKPAYAKEKFLIDTVQYFAKTTVQKIASLSDIEVFKPYLVIQDLGGDSEVQFRSVIDRVPGLIRSITDENDNLHPGVAFEGYLDIVTGGRTAEAMQRSRNYIESVFSNTSLSSFYSSLDEYFMDMSIESMQSITGLLDATYLQNVEHENVGAGVGTGKQPPEGSEKFKDIGSSFARRPGVLPVGDEVGAGQQPMGGIGGFVGEEEQPSVGVRNEQERGPVSEPEAYEFKPQYTSPNERHNYEQVYTEPFVMSERRNPFSKIKGMGAFGGLAKLELTTDMIFEDMVRVVGSADRVHTLMISQTGLIGLNGVAYKPTFSEEFIEGLPYDIQGPVREGNVGHLFNFKSLTKFKMLVVLVVDNGEIAYGNLRRELGLKDFREIYNRLGYLEEVYVEGRLVPREGRSASEERYQFEEDLRVELKMPKIPSFKDMHVDKVFKNPVVKTLSNTFGWTAGAGIVYASASLIGGWAILAGALFGKGAYDYYKGRTK